MSMSVCYRYIKLLYMSIQNPLLWIKRNERGWGLHVRAKPLEVNAANLYQLTWVSLPCNRQTCRRKRIQRPVQITLHKQNHNKPTANYTYLNLAACLPVVAMQKGNSFDQYLTDCKSTCPAIWCIFKSLTVKREGRWDLLLNHSHCRHLFTLFTADHA